MFATALKMKILLLFALVAASFALPDGAPEDACVDMIPQHEVDPQDGNGGYTLSVSDDDGDGVYDGTCFKLNNIFEFSRVLHHPITVMCTDFGKFGAVISAFR